MQNLELSPLHPKSSYTYLALTHALFVVGGVVIALAWRLPEALVFSAPSLIIVLVAMLEPAPRDVLVEASVDRRRAIEGDVVTLTASLQSPTPVPVLEVELQPHKSLHFNGSLRALLSLDAKQTQNAQFELIVADWGVVELGHIDLRVKDRFGLQTRKLRYRIISTLRIHIHEEPARSLMEPDRFRRLVGSHLSQDRGDGCEIADIRPYQPGDRLQALNWRISARHDEPWVTLRHPDRSTKVVLLLDAFQRFGHQRTDSMRRSIRATLGLARLHLDAQDPVGLCIVGDGMRWFEPDLGPQHLHVLTDALLDLSTSSWAERRQTRGLVDRLIPADAVVLAVSPLSDNRFISVVSALRGRGQSVQLVEPVTHWPSYRGEASLRSQGPGIQAWRIYALQRQVLRQRLANGGVTVVPWEETQPFESVLLSLRMRQRGRRSGAFVR